MKRRTFLERSSLATVGTLLIPNFLKAYEANALGALEGDRVLVIIQLSGGNDGLNTVIPYQNDSYYKGRPVIGIEKSKVLQLTDEIGLNPAMEAFRRLYDDGHVSILNNVGYPNPDRSHFRSMDIWQSASNSDEYLSSGWLGRYLDEACADCETGPRRVMEMDDTLSLALKGNKVTGIATLNPEKLYKETRKNNVEKLAASKLSVADEHYAVGYLYKTLAETVSNAAYLYEKGKVRKSETTYPPTELGKGLRTISELINAGSDTRVYYISIAGFDTHVDQKNKQEKLLTQYSEAVSSFVNDLNKTGQLDRTKVLTFSEFGRRVKQNGSNGTDHGTANNVFLLGGPKRSSVIYNEVPDLINLDENGDLRYSIDFRNVYASLLRDWLGANDQVVLGRKFAGLPNLI